MTTSFDADRLLLTDSSNLWQKVSVDGKKLPANEWSGGNGAKMINDIWQANVSVTFAHPVSGEQTTLNFIPFVAPKHVRSGPSLRPAPESIETFKSLASASTKTNRRAIAKVKVTVTPAV